MQDTNSIVAFLISFKKMQIKKSYFIKYNKKKIQINFLNPVLLA